MLLTASSFKGLMIEAEDGRIGAFSDFLFDNRTWKLRWMVVDTGHWLPGRTVLVHPSAIGPSDITRGELCVRLTRQRVRRSPDLRQDQPVSPRIQDLVYDHYGWDPAWSGAASLDDAKGRPARPGGADTDGEVARVRGISAELDQADPHLQSLAAVTGYRMQATDGSIGALNTVMLDPDDWGIRYLAVDAKAWWPGQHMLLSPYDVWGISSDDAEVSLDISRAQVKASPAWNPAVAVDRAYEERLHGYYGWPDYAW